MSWFSPIQMVASYLEKQKISNEGFPRLSWQLRMVALSDPYRLG